MKSQKSILNIIIFIGVFISSALVVSKLKSSIGIKWFIGMSFFTCLFFASVYEIPLKEGIKAGNTKTKIAMEIIYFWGVPLIVGIVIGKIWG